MFNSLSEKILGTIIFAIWGILYFLYQELSANKMANEHGIPLAALKFFSALLTVSIVFGFAIYFIWCKGN